MTPQEAINVLASATEPGVKLSRLDYMRCQIALEELNKIVNPPKMESKE